MKTIYRYRYEIALFVLLCFFLPIAFFDPDTSFASALKLLLYAADVALIYLTIRKLFRLKWRKAIISCAQKVFTAIAKLFMRFLEKWPFTHGAKNIIMGETKFHFEFEEKITVAGRSAKHPKWKQLKTEREKLRYLYRHIISQRIKHGERIYSSLTPSEIEGMRENTYPESRIFDLYKDYRYDDRKLPEEDQIRDIKESYFDNLK